MKKWQLLIIAIVIATGAFIIVQQQETIRQYRQMAYYSLEKLTYPIEEVLALHENGDDAERQKMLEQLYVEFTAISDYAGVGLTTEPRIKDAYYALYTETRISFFNYLDQYVVATTTQQREEAYAALKGAYEAYKMQLTAVKEELIVEEPI